MRPFTLLAALTLIACVPRSTPLAPQRYDVVITNARIYDGAGNPWYYGDVAVSGDRIVRIAPRGALASAQAPRKIDATGLALAPGFIDVQGQSYEQLLFGDGRLVSKVSQGVTTEILGEGTTPAPHTPIVYSEMGWSDTTAARAISGRFAGEHGFGNWLDAMAAHGISVNVGSFLGAATVRMYAKGESQGAANAAELDSMRAVTRRAMEDGAFGVGSALIYPPGAFMSTEELIETAKAMAPYGGLYITHMRSEGDRLLEATAEALRIGREGGVPVEIFHLKVAGQRNWAKARPLVTMIDSARRAGQDVGATMYPYTAGATSLASCTPPWASADGKLLANLADAPVRKRIHDEMIAGRSDNSESLCELGTPNGVMVVGFRDSTLKRFEGMRLDEIARAMSLDWADALIELTLRERARLGALFFLASDENLRMQLRQPWIIIGTDADGIDPDSARSMTHPRGYGTYPQLIGQLSRDEGVMSMEEAIRKSTSAVAERLRIPNRGLIQEGMMADLVLFDPVAIADRATYVRPHAIAAGVRNVFVNGVETWRDGRHTGA
ncbi:MAG TPA: amidohydrolase family protein, partial [Gemmatimonadaceae bacterium]|nr:amidohydrolase family protein [Gemmatimonadaceae bacterium]